MKRKLVLMAVALLCSVGMWAASSFATATYSDPYTVTISNSTFDSDLSNWTQNDFSWHQDGDRKFAEKYWGTAAKTSVYIKRQITGLKKGHYQFTASAVARGSNTSENKVYLFIGDTKKYVYGDFWMDYTIDFDLSADGDVYIGFQSDEGHTCDWIAFDTAVLKYYGTSKSNCYYNHINTVISNSNLTWLIQNNDFSSYLSGWQRESTSCGNQQGGSGGMESWRNNNVNIYQTISVPNGKYRITVDMISGNDVKNAYLYASSGGNEVHSSVVSAKASAANYTTMCSEVSGKTLTVDNFVVTDGTLTIGVKDPSSGDGWIVIDNFTLTFIEYDNGTDFASFILDPAVTDEINWNNGRKNNDQQYSGAPDNTYLDTWNNTLDQYQYLALPSGYYLLKCATRADATITADPNIYVKKYGETSNIASTIIHHVGASGNLLGNGWGWTYVPFTLSEQTQVQLGFWSKCNSNKWAGADDFHLIYYTSEEAMQQAYKAHIAFDELRAAASAIKDVARTETTVGSYTTFTTAISNQVSAADNATAASDINSAISTLKAAIKTYINGAEPENEGDSFDITCLITNPDFSENNTTGWTSTHSGGTTNTSFTNNEFYNNTFDFYQNLTGLANGSYKLTVQAYSRPGDNGDLADNKKAYYDYTQGVNNVTAELYVNNDASRVGNIYAYKESTSRKHNPGSWQNDYECVVDGGTNYFVPNCMEGASKYFADEDVYKTTVAALVEDGNLRIGFRDKTLTTNQWTIFDNFHLYYYGSSKMIYLKQYLPQLEAEITANFLENGAYDVLKTGQTERAALASANSANADELDTEEDLQDAIDAITTARDNFVAAKDAYLDLSDALTTAAGYITNSGSGIFQVTSVAAGTLSTLKTTSQGVYDAGTASKSDVDTELATLNTAITTAAATLNAPDSEKRYVLTIVEAGKDWNGYAVTFREGDTNADQGNFGIKYQTTTNADYNQAIKFTAITGNTYKLSVTRADGTEMYLTTSKKGYNKDDGGFGDERIRMTSDASKALEVEIRPTSTANQFQLYNSTAPGIIANNNNNDMYTANSCNFTIAEASQASVTVKANAGKYGTVIFPFKPDVSTGFDGITFYSIDGINDVTNRVRLNVVANPVANTPYLIKNASEDNLNKPITGWGAAYKDSYDSGDTDIKLTGVYTAATIAASVAATADTDGAYRYVLQTQDATQAFYKVDANFTATAYKCYLTVKQDKTGGGVKAFFLDFGDADGIQAIDNGQLTIDNEKTEIYNLAGQKMSKLQRGVNIVKGKKVLVK